MQIKTTARYHLTPVRVTITKKTRISRCWRRGSPGALLGGTKTGAATMQNSMAVPPKIKNRTDDSTSGYKSEGNKVTVLNRYTHPCVFTAASVTTAETWKRPRVHQQMGGYRRRGRLQWSVIQSQKRRALNSLRVDLEGVLQRETGPGKTNTP